MGICCDRFIRYSLVPDLSFCQGNVRTLAADQTSVLTGPPAETRSTAGSWHVAAAIPLSVRFRIAKVVSPCEKLDRGQIDPRFSPGDRGFGVFGAAAVTIEPGEG